MNIQFTIQLNNGVKIPLLGYGTYKTPPGHVTYESVSYALKAGYVHIDTAERYANEKDVGKAIHDSIEQINAKGVGLSRDKLFITTKLWVEGADLDPEKSLHKSLSKLDLDYVDLYLIHQPIGDRVKIWKALEKLLAEGKCKAIGVSNFTISHLEELLEKTNIVPAINQVEFNPFLYQKELHEYCISKNIQLEAHTPLARGQKLDNPVLTEIALHHNKSPAQIMIKWALQHNIVVLPKSIHIKRIEENANVFDFSLSAKDMKTLNSLNEDLRLCRDPTDVP